MMIRAHMRGVGEVDIGFFPMRQSLDPREFLLEPLLHQRLVPFQRTMQRLLASDAKLSQTPCDRDQAQRDVEFSFDQRRHHLTRPQRKCELELQRVLLRHRVVNPLQLLAIEFRRTSKQRLGLQCAPATTSILCQPAIDRRTIDTQNTSNNFRAFAVLNTAHRTLTHGLQRGVIQPSRIVLPHPQRESYSPRHVKNSLFTCVLINSIEHHPEFIDIRLILAGSRACPKPVTSLADDAVRRVVATRDPDDEDIAARSNRHWVKGDIRYSVLNTTPRDLLKGKISSCMCM